MQRQRSTRALPALLVAWIALSVPTFGASPASAQEASSSAAADNPEPAEEAPVEVPGGFFAPALGTGFESLIETGEPQRSDSEVLIEGIAAQVGNGVVLVSEVRRLAAPIEARMRKAGAPEGEIRAMRSEALERLIEQRLIEDIVRRAQLSASDAEVDGAVAAIAKENGLTLEQMQQSIASHGLTIEEYRAKIKNEIERNKVLGSMVRSRVSIEESEVRALYAQKYGAQRKSGSEIHLRHLLVAVAAEKLRDQETACRMAAEMREQIVAGNISFSAAASRMSDTNAERGGDLGWVHVDELAGWMAPAVANLQAGEVSEVVPMYFGCNLLQVEERRDFRPITLEEAKPALEQALFQQKMEQEYVRWIDTLREQVYIERKGVYAEATRVGGASTASSRTKQ
jgi:peptidyl-prolyl cis-trans isomerase SurA